MTGMPIIEICCAGADDVAAALEGGASRIELCAALSAEGVTPSPGMISEVLRMTPDVPVTVLVRPREGDFCYTPREVDVMVADVRAIRAAGASGVTIGALDAARMPDREALRRLIEAAGPEMQITFHRAIDDCADPVAAVEMLIEAGVHRVLTSGGAPSAMDGAEVIRMMVERAAGHLEIMPGGGIRPDNIARLRALTGARQFHSSARNKINAPAAANPIFGASPATVDAGIVRALVTNLSLLP